MAYSRQQFDLVGYSEDLERRPLKFVDSIPASRICSACGNIPRLTYTLMCGHTFCQPCFESFATTSDCVCPLDGDVCDRDDVSGKDYKAEQPLGRKAHCWNEANGCGVMLPASQIADHVRHDCQHHVTCCPKCSAEVLIRDVCAHLTSRCAALVLHAAPEAQEGPDDKEIPHLVAFERKVEQRVDELDVKLAQLSLESSSHSDKLLELCHNVNHLKETLKEHISNQFDRNETEMKALIANDQTIQQKVCNLDAKISQLCLRCGSMSDKLMEVCSSNNHLKEALTEQFGQASHQNLTEMKALYCEKFESLRTAPTSEWPLPRTESKTHQRIVTEYAAFKENAPQGGWTTSWSGRVYLRRYLMSWGIAFTKEGKRVCIALCFQLHEGREDDLLDWPFRKELKLNIIHPETRQERLLCAKGSAHESVRKLYSRPIEGSNTPARFDGTKIQCSDIERDGYVEEDQLLLRFEVV